MVGQEMGVEAVEHRKYDPGWEGLQCFRRYVRHDLALGRQEVGWS